MLTELAISTIKLSFFFCMATSMKQILPLQVSSMLFFHLSINSSSNDQKLCLALLTTKNYPFISSSSQLPSIWLSLTILLSISLLFTIVSDNHGSFIWTLVRDVSPSVIASEVHNITVPLRLGSGCG